MKNKKSIRSQRIPSLIVIAVLMALAVVSVMATVRWFKSNNLQASLSQAAREPTVSAPKTIPKVDFNRLKGRWQRPDGGYVIEIREVDSSGKINISYFNPKPINVSKSEASQDGEIVKVFIELRDVNYPGSTYQLIYDPRYDCLKGNYFQAALKENFDVYFERLKQ